MDDRIITAVLEQIDKALRGLELDVFSSNIRTIEGFKGIEGHYRGLQEARHYIVTEMKRRDDDE